MWDFILPWIPNNLPFKCESIHIGAPPSQVSILVVTFYLYHHSTIGHGFLKWKTFDTSNCYTTKLSVSHVFHVWNKHIEV